MTVSRRGLLGILGLTAGAAVSVALPKSKPKGFVWKSVCFNGHESEQFIDLSGPLKVGNQCPQCLYMLDLDGLGEEIIRHNELELS